MKVKAILVAGGHGSRLYPFTKITQKTLLPIYDRPVIDYALGTIRRAGIKNNNNFKSVYWANCQTCWFWISR